MYFNCMNTASICYLLLYTVYTLDTFKLVAMAPHRMHSECCTHFLHTCYFRAYHSLSTVQGILFCPQVPFSWSHKRGRVPYPGTNTQFYDLENKLLQTRYHQVLDIHNIVVVVLLLRYDENFYILK